MKNENIIKCSNEYYRYIKDEIDDIEYIYYYLENLMVIDIYVNILEFYQLY